MTTFTITVGQRIVQYGQVEVEAATEAEAIERAKRIVGGHPDLDDVEDFQFDSAYDGDFGEVFLCAIRGAADKHRDIHVTVEGETTCPTCDAIRAVLGSEHREMDEDSGVEFDCVSDVNAVIDILHRVKAVESWADCPPDEDDLILTDPERDGDERLRITS